MAAKKKASGSATRTTTQGGDIKNARTSVKRYEPTELARKTVMLAKFSGFTHAQTARLLEISEETLVKYYQPELDQGADRMRAAVAGNLYTIATQTQDRKSALTACIFLAKTRLGWRETASFDAEVKRGKDGGGDEVVTVTLRLGDRDAD